MWRMCCVFFFKQKTAYEMRISDWSSDVCSSDLGAAVDLAEAILVLDAHVRIERRVGALVHERVHRRDLDTRLVHRHQKHGDAQIGRASCRERVCQYE